MKSLVVIFLLLSFRSFGQEILIYGKNINLNAIDTQLHFQFSEQFPAQDLERFEVVLIFSTANSSLSKADELKLQEYVNNGGSLYLGADNIPFVEECNQLTSLFYNAQFYGNFQQDTISGCVENSLKIKMEDNYNSGETTVSFPMDYRLRVEAWSNDNPIILSGNIGKGKVVLDGGYSRFYKLNENAGVMQGILNFLLGN